MYVTLPLSQAHNCLVGDILVISVRLFQRKQAEDCCAVLIPKNSIKLAA